MMISNLKMMTAAAMLAATTAASAGTSPFTLVSGATAPGVDVSLTLQESTVPGYDYDFVVSNNSLGGIVTGVYFEVDWNSKLAGAGHSTGPALLNPGSLSPAIDGWEGTKGSHTVGQSVQTHWIARGRYYNTYHDILEDGVLVGQTQVFSFMTDTDIVSLGDLEDVLGTDGFGVAIRMQDLTSDPQEAGYGEVQNSEESAFLQVLAANVNTDDDQAKVTGAPTPTAAIAGLAMLGVVGLRRRRNK